MNQNTPKYVVFDGKEIINAYNFKTSISSSEYSEWSTFKGGVRMLQL